LRGVWVSVGFGAFEKIKCIFSSASVGNFREDAGVFLTEKHSPDAVCRGTGRWPLESGVLLSLIRGSRAHRTPCTGRRGSAVHASGACWDLRASLRVSLTRHRSESGAQRPVLVCFADLSAHESGEVVCLQTSLHVTGEYRTRPVLTWSRPVVRR